MLKRKGVCTPESGLVVSHTPGYNQPGSSLIQLRSTKRYLFHLTENPRIYSSCSLTKDSSDKKVRNLSWSALQYLHSLNLIQVEGIQRRWGLTSRVHLAKSEGSFV
ncbi:hypothetical protein RRG08_000471 [Elysia crispata]|uniref:Uncharacterized protein n=1 Tax=Elysia crispata TaxID=231223 RepID=A0AAE1CWR2_9GAST|nr:hypothetical protein RRG08_000471 [Elysia crispata]